MSYSDQTLKRLFALSGNVCAFPGCPAPIVDTDMDVVVGDICHIKGKSENGPRYDPTQTDAERNSYENLLVMCVAHNRIVDGKKTRHLYPVERLQEFKRNHEARYQGSVVDNAALDAFVEAFTVTVTGSVITTYNQSGGQNANTIINYAQQEKPQVALSPAVTCLLTKVDHSAGLDFYDFRVGLRNDGTRVVRDFAVEVEIPQKYMDNAGSYAAQVNSRRPGVTYMFRHTQQNFRDFALYAGDTYPAILLGFVLKREHYLQGVTEAIVVRVHSGDELLSETEYPVAEMLNEERVEMILGPRLAALKRIYEAARGFLGEEGDPTGVTIYLADEPISGKRGVQVEGAYNMMKALAKAGWLTVENEEALAVNLTDDGARVASS